MPSVIDQRLASLFHLTQIERLVRIEGIANDAEQIIRRAFRELVAAVGRGADIGPLIRQLPTLVNQLLADRFVRLASYAHSTTVDCYARGIPRAWLRLLNPATILAGEATVDLGVGFASYDEPVMTNGRMGDAEWAAYLQRNIFQPPPPARVEQIILTPVAGATWPQRVQALSRLVQDPNAVASELRDGYAAGEGIDQLQRRIQPLADNWASSARRIARTEGSRIAESIQQETYGQLGGLMAGKQIIATLDERTRPEHRLWHGRIYWIDGRRKPNVAQFPSLPAGPNCRCTSVPVLKPPKEFETDPAIRADFQNASGHTIPDPSAYSDWFRQADIGRRKMAVGVARYRTVQNLLGGRRQPEWTDFIDQDGRMLSVTQLRGETQRTRDARVGKVAGVITQRMELLGQVSRFGFTYKVKPEPPEPTPRIRPPKPPTPPTPTPKVPLGLTGKRPSNMPMEDFLRDHAELNEVVRRMSDLESGRDWEKFKADAEIPIVTDPNELIALRAQIDGLKAIGTPEAKKTIKLLERRLEQLTIQALQEVENRQEARKRADQAKQQLAKESLQILRVKDAAKIDHEWDTVLFLNKALYTPNIDPTLSKRVADALAFVNSITVKRKGLEKFKIDFLQFRPDLPATQRRANAREDLKQVRIDRADGTTVAVHEVGHHLEFQGKAAVAGEFVKLRVRRAGKPDTNLQQQFPGWNYRPDEIGNDDEFGKAFDGRGNASSKYYCGKVYGDGATEAISMGIQKLYDDPWWFATHDPEYFKFIVAILRDLL